MENNLNSPINLGEGNVQVMDHNEGNKKTKKKRTKLTEEQKEVLKQV